MIRIFLFFTLLILFLSFFLNKQLSGNKVIYHYHAGRKGLDQNIGSVPERIQNRCSCPHHKLVDQKTSHGKYGKYDKFLDLVLVFIGFKHEDDT